MKTKTEAINSNIDLNFFSEKEQMAFNDTALSLKKLSYLASNFDPFLSVDEQRSENLLAIMEEFGLDQYLNDPFVLTNHLLKLIDLLEQDLKITKH